MTTLAHQPPQLARANNIDICYEVFGDANAEPLLLIMGLGAQMIHWDDEFCRQLAARGFRVIRFDNRDIGKSSRLSGGKRLTALELIKLRFLKIPVAAPYKLADMARDTIGLMDALGIRKAHLVGELMEKYLLAMNLPSRAQLVGMAERLQSMENQLNEIKTLLQQVHHNSLAPDDGYGATPRPPRTKRPPSEGDGK